jgi:hypothetical protein
MVIITAYILLVVISVRTVVVLTCLGKIILRKIYYDPTSPASFSGPDKLYVYVKKDGKYNISKYKIKKWLQRQEPYSMQRPLRKPSNRTHIVVAGIDDQWSADLMDTIKFSKYNDVFTYVLVVIDVFSKYLWLRKLRQKRRLGSSRL